MSGTTKEAVLADLSDVSRRELIKRIGPIGVLALAGCAGEEEPSTDDDIDGTDGTDSKGPKMGGTLRAGWRVGVETMDARHVIGLQSLQIYQNIYSQLVEYRRDGNELKLVGDLATDWEYEDDTTLVFELNEDAIFHNGDPVTAEDVKYTWDTMQTDEYTGNLMFGRPDIKAVVRDDHTIEFDLGDTPHGPMINTFAYIGYAVVSKKADQNQDMGKNPIGSGPFTFEEWVDGDHVYLNKFDDYWKTDDDGNDLPYLDRVEINIMPEANTKVQGIKGNNLDVIDTVPRRNLVDLNNNEDIVTNATPTGSNHGVLQFNLEEEPFSDIHVRKAVLHAVDWQAVIDNVLFGNGEPANNEPLPPQTGWNTGLDTPYMGVNMDKAEEHLNQAEIDVTQTVTNVVSRGDTVREKAYQVFHEQLQSKLDMNFELRILDGSTVLERIGNNEFGFHILEGTGTWDPSQTLQFRFAEGALYNLGGYNKKSIFDLLDEATQVNDKEKRKEMYHELYSINDEDAAKFYGYWEPNVSAFRPYVKNFNFLFTQQIYLDDVWLDK